jgi:hypothetical protein
LKRTHAEALDFLQRHPGILECVKHIHEENGSEGHIQCYISPGYASALLYLMATSQSDNEKYKENPCESLLDLGLYEKACEFWVSLASNDPSLKPLQTALAAVLNDDEAGGSLVAERIALIVKTWNNYVDGQTVKSTDLKLEYVQDSKGINRLAEHPAVGGIDIGDPKEGEELAERVEEQKKVQLEKKLNSGSPSKKTAKKKMAKKKKRISIVGKLYWFVTDGNEPRRGKVADVDGEGNADLVVCDGFQGAGNKMSAPISTLTKEQPTSKGG